MFWMLNNWIIGFYNKQHFSRWRIFYFRNCIFKTSLAFLKLYLFSSYSSIIKIWKLNREFWVYLQYWFLLWKFGPTECSPCIREILEQFIGNSRRSTVSQLNENENKCITNNIHCYNFFFKFQCFKILEFVLYSFYG